MIKYSSRLQPFVLAAAVLLPAVPAAHAVPITYITNLSGPNESPPNASPGTGNATIILDTDANTLRVLVTYADLTAAVTAAHIHCCTTSPGTGTANVATQTPSFINFPAGLSGNYDMTFDTTLASTYRAGFITDSGGTPADAEAALAAGLNAGLAYFNIHTTTFPGGEIRGFLQAVPEPESFALMGIGLVGIAVAARRRKVRE